MIEIDYSKYPESNKLNKEELKAIEFHIRLDHRLGHTDKKTWPEWLVLKMEKAINNPLKEGGDI